MMGGGRDCRSRSLKGRGGGGREEEKFPWQSSS